MSTAVQTDVLEQLDFEPREVVRLLINCSWRDTYVISISVIGDESDMNSWEVIYGLQLDNWRDGFHTLDQAVTWLNGRGYERATPWETSTEFVPEEQGTIWKADWAVTR